MYNGIATCVDRMINPSRTKLNILVEPTHEAYQTLLGELGHNFYMIQGNGIKTWDFHTKPLPKNHFIINRPIEISFPLGIRIDLVLSQQRFGNLQRFADIAQKLGVPHVTIDHCLPPSNWTKTIINRTKEIPVDKRIFITEFSKTAWFGTDQDIILYHGIDPVQFSGWTGGSEAGISVVNKFASRDVFCGWNIWSEAAKKIPVELVGDNPGLSESAKSTDELVSKLRKAKYFLNTSQWSPIPMSLVEAMMVGCPIITTRKQEIPKFITHEVNGLFADTPEEIVAAAARISENPEFAAQLGQNARATALEYFGLDRFVKEWNNVLADAYRNFK